MRAKKGADVLALDLREAGAFTDYFVLCTGQNRRQVQAIADGVEAALKARKLRPSHVEGYERGEWVLLDYFDFVVHVFAPNARMFYGLERLWGSAHPLSLPDPRRRPPPRHPSVRASPESAADSCRPLRLPAAPLSAPYVNVRTLADAALAVLLAPCCATCGGVLERPLDGAVCAGCWARVACFSPPLCAACGEPLPSARTHPGERCVACSIMLGPATVARSVGAFDGMLADVVHALKYGRRPSVARPLAALMRRAGGDLLAGIDVAVPVPLHRRRLRERGFNQAEALARGLGVPLCHALRRSRSHAGTSGAVGRRPPRQPARRVRADSRGRTDPRPRGGAGGRRPDHRRHGDGVRRRAGGRRAAAHRRAYGSPSRERTAALTAARTASAGSAPSTSCQVGAAAWRR